jgi:Cro/C1-type HTH DNA-binding domain
MARQTKIQRFDVEGFTAHILKTMKERGTSHQALAKETGLALGTITRMRREQRRPATDAFLALCHWSNADPMRFHMQQKASEALPQKASPFAGLIQS